MTVLVKFQIEISFAIELHGNSKLIVDDVMSTVVCLHD